MRHSPYGARRETQDARDIRQRDVRPDVRLIHWNCGQLGVSQLGLPSFVSRPRACLIRYQRANAQEEKTSPSPTLRDCQLLGNVTKLVMGM